MQTFFLYFNIADRVYRWWWRGAKFLCKCYWQARAGIKISNLKRPRNRFYPTLCNKIFFFFLFLLLVTTRWGAQGSVLAFDIKPRHFSRTCRFLRVEGDVAEGCQSCRRLIRLVRCTFSRGLLKRNLIVYSQSVSILRPFRTSVSRKTDNVLTKRRWASYQQTPINLIKSNRLNSLSN